MKPEEVNRNLHAATDRFAIQEGFSEAFKTSHFNTSVKVHPSALFMIRKAPLHPVVLFEIEL